MVDPVTNWESSLAKKILIQEHKIYPKAIFKGKYEDGRAIGTLNIHGVAKDVNVPATIEIAEKHALLNTQFSVNIKDFGVSIPKIVANKFAAEAKIKLNCIMIARWKRICYSYACFA